MAHESAAKAYVLNLGEALHHELAPAGVKVLVMLPGNVDTAMIDKVGLERDRLPIKPLPAATAVRQTIAALQAGRATLIPDRRLRMLTHLTPRRVLIRMNGRLLATATPGDRSGIEKHPAPGPA
jgi:short-subunit dehydrogenase